MPRIGRRAGRRGRVLAAAALLALLAAGPALAQDATAALRQQAAQLRQALDALDARLRQLETAAPAAAAGPMPAPEPQASRAPAAAPRTEPAADSGVVAPVAAPEGPTAAAGAIPGISLSAHQRDVLAEQVRVSDALAAWRGIHVGTGQDEVRRLLGPPPSVLTVGNRTGWVYSYGSAGRGSVFFDRAGVAVSLLRPDQGALHLY